MRLHFYFASFIIMEILMNRLTLFTFYSLLQDIYREETAAMTGEDEIMLATKKMGGDVEKGGSAVEEVRGNGGVGRGGRGRRQRQSEGKRHQRRK